jgi:hypothetical protein
MVCVVPQVTCGTELAIICGVRAEVGVWVKSVPNPYAAAGPPTSAKIRSPLLTTAFGPMVTFI